MAHSLHIRRGAAWCLVPTALVALLLTTTSASGQLWASCDATAGHNEDPNNPPTSKNCYTTSWWNATCTCDARDFSNDGQHSSRGYGYATSYYSIFGWSRSATTSTSTPQSCCYASAHASAGRNYLPFSRPLIIIGSGEAVGVPVHLSGCTAVCPWPGGVADASTMIRFEITPGRGGKSVIAGSAELWDDGSIVCDGFFEDGFFDVHFEGDYWVADYIGPPEFEIELPVGVEFELDHVVYAESESVGPCPSELPETVLAMEATLPDGYMFGGDEFLEDFEQYNTVDPLPDQSAWEPWDDNPDAAEFYTTQDHSRSGLASVAIDDNDDAVHRFAGYTEGIWEFKAWQYIPENMNDLQYFILLNTYPASESQHWSMQIECDGAQGLIRDFNGDETLPMVKGQWCEIKVVIDLDEDEQSVYYNGAPLVTKSWSEGVAPGGAINIAALDLWGNASSSNVYYDDISLTQSEGTPCPGDIDGDGDVDTADLLALLAAWGACP